MRSIVGLRLCTALLGLAGTARSETCVQCHRNATPGIVAQPLAGRMGKAGIDCRLRELPRVRSPERGRRRESADAYDTDLCRPPSEAGDAAQGRQARTRLDAVQAARMAALDRAAFDESRARMVSVYAKCHGKTFAGRQLSAADDVVRETDRVMAEAIRAVQGLYRDGLLRKPEQWLTAPDILQFEAKTEVERELYGCSRSTACARSRERSTSTSTMPTGTGGHR